MQFVVISKHKKIARIDEVLRSVNMSTLKSAIVNTLSGGEQQRVALACATSRPDD